MAGRGEEAVLHLGWFKALLEHWSSWTAPFGLSGFSPGTATEQKSLKYPVFILEVMEHVCLLSQHLLNTF